MKGKLNVILDLDQTLISGEELPFDLKKNKEKMKKFDHKTMENFFIIFARPHLQEFLDYLFENFNVAVWTAATKDYALFIVKHFILNKPGRKLNFIFYSHHCDMSQKLKKGLKGLSILWDDFKLKKYNENNTIIIDDNPDVLVKQACNVIQIKPFQYNDRASYNDTEFYKIQQELSKIDEYMRQGIVRTCLKK
uniref:FCP1 homology domain-containing protein n=1 Tax=viral metagenome TaxID=1070528 RepID=A0A6C0KRK9_9ZZZZ